MCAPEVPQNLFGLSNIDLRVSRDVIALQFFERNGTVVGHGERGYRAASLMDVQNVRATHEVEQGGATDDVDHELCIAEVLSHLSSGLLRVEDLDHESASETSFQDAEAERLRTLPQDEKSERCCRFLKRVTFAASNLEQPVRAAP